MSSICIHNCIGPIASANLFALTGPGLQVSWAINVNPEAGLTHTQKAAAIKQGTSPQADQLESMRGKEVNLLETSLLIADGLLDSIITLVIDNESAYGHQLLPSFASLPVSLSITRSIRAF